MSAERARLVEDLFTHIHGEPPDPQTVELLAAGKLLACDWLWLWDYLGCLDDAELWAMHKRLLPGGKLP